LRDIILSVNQPLQALVIDDEPLISNFIAKILTADGWSVSKARTAEQAFEMLSERQWLLVFCDVMLGGIDGYAVLRRFSEKTD
jgi:DNA-binding response OmpR family regulator